MKYIAEPFVICNGACHSAISVEATILAPCHVIKCLQFIWRLGAHWLIIRVPKIGHLESSHNNGLQGGMPYHTQWQFFSMLIHNIILYHLMLYIFKRYYDFFVHDIILSQGLFLLTLICIRSRHTQVTSYIVFFAMTSMIIHALTSIVVYLNCQEVKPYKSNNIP